MPQDSTGQVVSAFTYDAVTSSTISRTLPVEVRQTTISGDPVDEFYLSLNTGAIAQVSTLTVSGAIVAGEQIFAIVTDAAANVFKYIYEIQTGDTIALAGSRLASLINLDSAVAAVSVFASTTATVTVTSATPRLAFTITSGKSAAATITVGAVVTGTPSSGVAMKRKLAEVFTDFAPTADGFLSATTTIKFYDGASAPVLLQTQSTAIYKHTRSTEAIRTSQSAT